MQSPDYSNVWRCMCLYIMLNVIVYECLYMYHYHTYVLLEELFM